MKFELPDEAATLALGAGLAQVLLQRGHGVVFLHGDLGAGIMRFRDLVRDQHQFVWCDAELALPGEALTADLEDDSLVFRSHMVSDRVRCMCEKGVLAQLEPPAGASVNPSRALFCVSS